MTFHVHIIGLLVFILQVQSGLWAQTPLAETGAATYGVFDRIRKHAFHPVRDGFTYDRVLKQQGVADLTDGDGKVRLLAVRDLVRAGEHAAIRSGLRDANAHVRHVAAMSLGILQVTNAAPELTRLLAADPDSVVRAQAAVTLWQMGARSALMALRVAKTNDASRDVQHQAELAIYAIEQGTRATPELAAAYARLDQNDFRSVRVGAAAPDFVLTDTEGKAWRLSDFRGQKPVVLIWVFADWCPVCHGEFSDLIEMKAAFVAAGVQVFTIECHDTYPARVMVGREFEPHYWFSKKPFKEEYTRKIWWPHLVDRAGAVGATYGVDPMAFVVHAEWINRPGTVIIDQTGMVRFAYFGTFWGDRPDIRKTLEMVTRGEYDFEHPQRRKVPKNTTSREIQRPRTGGAAIPIR